MINKPKILLHVKDCCYICQNVILIVPYLLNMSNKITMNVINGQNKNHPVGIENLKHLND